MSRNIQKEQEKIIEVIDQLRPFLVNDGGNIEFIKYGFKFLLPSASSCLIIPLCAITGTSIIDQI